MAQRKHHGGAFKARVAVEAIAGHKTVNETRGAERSKKSQAMGIMNIFRKYPNSTFLKGLPDDSKLFPLRERIAELFSSLDGLQDPHFGEETETGTRDCGR